MYFKTQSASYKMSDSVPKYSKIHTFSDKLLYKKNYKRGTKKSMHIAFVYYLYHIIVIKIFTRSFAFITSVEKKWICFFSNEIDRKFWRVFKIKTTKLVVLKRVETRVYS